MKFVTPVYKFGLWVIRKTGRQTARIANCLYCSTFNISHDDSITYTDKKENQISSYIRKFRMKQLQSHIWLTASSYMGKYLRILHILESSSSYTVWLCNCYTLNFLIDEENLIFFFISVMYSSISLFKSSCLDKGLSLILMKDRVKMLEHDWFYVLVPANCEAVWPPGEFHNAFLDSREHIFLFACSPWGVLTTCPWALYCSVVVGE